MEKDLFKRIKNKYDILKIFEILYNSVNFTKVEQDNLKEVILMKDTRRQTSGTLPVANAQVHLAGRSARCLTAH